MHPSPCTCRHCGERPPEPCAPPCPPPGGRCRAPVPCRPGKPPAAEGVILQKIVWRDRRTLPCLCAALSLCVPDAAQPPLRLLSACESGAQPMWTPLDGPDCAGRVTIRVSIPISAQVCDACGRRFAASGQVDAETCLPQACAGCYSLFILPCVRLLHAGDCAQGAVFQVRLHVSLDVYAVRPEPCMLRRPEPACPDLPLYPPPIRQGPPCWPQCPAAPDPCGWQAPG